MKSKADAGEKILNILFELKSGADGQQVLIGVMASLLANSGFDYDKASKTMAAFSLAVVVAVDDMNKKAAKQ